MRRKGRFIDEFGLSAYDPAVLVADKESSMYFEKVASGVKNKKLAANWVISELFGALKNAEVEITDCPIPAENLAEMIGLIEDDTIRQK